jgi:methylamine dehydrogenase accessory protein MauD
MEGPWLISYLALWGLTVLLALVILAHSRLLGLLHHRFGPASARPLADGPRLGTKLEQVAGRHLDGTAWARAFPAERPLLLVFVSPQCQTCNSLLPHAKDFARAQAEIDLALVSLMDDRGMNEAYVEYGGLHKLRYVLGSRLARQLDVEGTPYAIHVDRQGVVTAKGLVNHYEHLLSLVQPPSSNGAEGNAGEPGATDREEMKEEPRGTRGQEGVPR